MLIDEVSIPSHESLEAELAETRAQLREMKDLMNRSPVIVLRRRLADGWPIEFVSANITQFGYTTDDLLAGRITGTTLIHPCDLSRVQREVSAYLKQEISQFTLEYRLCTQAGEERWVDDHLMVIRDDDGTVTHLESMLLDITERRRADAILLARETRFRMMIEHSTEAIALLDQHGTFLYASPAAARINGYQLDEFVGQNAFAILHPEDLGEVQRLSAEAAQKPGSIINIQFRLQHKSGAWRWIDGMMHNLLADPAIQAIVLNYRDITEYKQAEEALRQSHAKLEKRMQERTAELEQVNRSLRESEERFRCLFERSHAMMLFVDPESKRILDANPAACVFHQYTHAELTAKRICEINMLSPEEVDQQNHRTIGLDNRYFTRRHRLANGEIRDVDVYAGPLQLDGKTVIYSILHDVTERRQTERALAYEQAFLDAAVEMLPMPLAFVNAKWQFIRINRAAREMMERLELSSISEIKPLDHLTHTPVPRYASPLVRALHGEVVSAEEYVFAVTATAQEIPCLISAAPIRIDDTVVAAVSLFEEITALKEADRAKDEFLAILSHELQTPLTSILGWSDLALVGNSPELLAQAMTIVQRNARRQKALIADMLDMSRLIHRKLAITPTQTDLNEQVHLAVENVLRQAHLQQITVMLQLAATPLPIFADPSRLQQCLDNLLHNSMKFTPPGGTITVTCQRDSESALLTVQDTGRGIAPANLPLIFTPFRQVNRLEPAGGLGLGLAIVRGIIDLHGGRIWAESAGIGKGSAFHIALSLYTHNA